jgi:hypothetical protein
VPDVCADSGGVSPGWTLASTFGVFAGSGSGGSAVTVYFLKASLTFSPASLRFDLA